MKRLLIGIFLLALSLFCNANSSPQNSLQRKSVVIPVQFLDVKFTKENIVQSIDSLFNMERYNSNGATGSVKDYFRDNIVGEEPFSFHVTDVVTLIKPSIFYGQDVNQSTDAWLPLLVEEACRAVSRKGLDFSQFDADENGAVDNVFIIFAGYNQSESGVSDHIKPQISEISSQNVVLNGKKIATYCCYSEYSGSEGKKFAGPGTICHELLHILGLVDLYDVNGEEEGLSDALYRTTAIMDYGNYNNNGNTPPYLSAVEREQIGQLVVTDVEIGGHYELEPIYTNKAYRINTPTENEYFLLEYRDGSCWDSNIGGKGLLIYQIDKSTQLAGYHQADIRWQLDIVNCSKNHPCATIFDPLGNNLLEEMFYPSATDKIISIDTKDLVAWNGLGTGVGLKNISITEDNKLAFDVVEDFGWEIPSVEHCKVEVYKSNVYLKWIPNKEYKSTIWQVTYGKTGGLDKTTKLVNGNTCLLGGLIPRVNYTCSIVMYDGDFHGDTYTIEFENTPEDVSFPLIADMKGTFSVGDVVYLYISNVVEPILSEQWYLNGKQYSDSKLVFTEAGNYTIKVEYTTNNRDFYSLEKRVKVVQ